MKQLISSESPINNPDYEYIGWSREFDVETWEWKTKYLYEANK